MKKKVLVVEDDEALGQVLCHTLMDEGFEVRCVADGDKSLDVARAFGPDLVLLDIMLPGRNGFELCTEWRREGRFPIIIVTSRDRKQDELRGLQLGADDYVTKPFDLETLLARIQAVLRRRRPTFERVTLGPVTIDFVNVTARKLDRAIGLTHQEFELVRYLAERPHNIVYRDELLRAVWGSSADPFTRAVDKAIARLRKKLEPDPKHPRFIHTAHGNGYYLTPDE